MKAEPAASVAEWISRSDSTAFATTSITQAEILHGVMALSSGRRRTALERAAEAIFAEDFGGRVLRFDSRAARACAEIVSERSRIGRPISQFDAQIAAIARSAGAVLATRNVRDFEQCGTGVVDPWA